ncbi:hypothetical protein [Flavobacterium gelatinilyticum]|uniref:hypothetical protein n=1 Tax=Flavobacterium gelatinilyticum TaxID=3003260 RepID=UPI00248173EA|nr:hypothetical protein [Flavobacterium gelatinilyticum]
MEEVRYNKIALILVFLIVFFILMHPPFVLSIYVPTYIRLSLFLFIVLFSLFTIVFRRYFIKIYIPILLFFTVCAFYWLLIGAIFEEIVYTLLYVLLAIVLMVSVRRNKSLRGLVIKFYFILVLILSILSIISFLGFNLDLVSYTLKPVGEGDYVYQYFHNYFLGYINPKVFESGVIGRVCGFLFEPSYQGWFLSTNFFLLSKWIKNRWYLILAQIIVFLGALSSFSTMSWVVFAIVFVSILGFKFMSILTVREKTANIIYSLTLFVGILTLFTVVSQDKLFEALGPSSSEDRTNRLDTSSFFLFTASPVQLMLGRGPGFIGKNSDRGESNPIVKSLVENGLIVTVFVLIFIIYCTYRSKYYMIANLLWLNSVVILFTPLFIVNVLVCKWLAEIEDN